MEPSTGNAGMTPDQLAEAKQYGRIDLICMLADRVIDLVFLAAFAWLVARPLDTWLQGYGWLDKYWSLRLVALFLLMTAVHVAVSFPLSFYSGFVVEHRFHLSTLSLGRWLRRYGTRNLLALALALVLFLGLYWLIWTTGAWWWLVAAGAFFLVGVVLGQLAPVLILPLFYKIERLEMPELTERLACLAEGSGLSIAGVYRMALSAETVKANAMLAGLGRTRRVLLGDTLLDQFSPEEIEVVFAHEIGHHVHHHISKMIVTGIGFSLAGFWICDRLLTLLLAGPSGRIDYAALPVWTLPAVMLVLTLFATLLEPLQNALSRHYERQSDRYALRRTGQTQAFVTAFQKLAVVNKDDPNPPWLEVVLFHSHPPVSERLALADEATV